MSLLIPNEIESLPTIARNLLTMVRANLFPSLSSKTIGIFRSCMNSQTETIDLPLNLKAKATDLIRTIEQLERAQNNALRNKLLGFLISAATISVLVGGALATLATVNRHPPFFISVLFATAFTYSLISYANMFSCLELGLNEQDLRSLQNFEGALLIAWIGGPFFSIYEGFFKTSMLEMQVMIRIERFMSAVEKLPPFLTQYKSLIEPVLLAKIEELRNDPEIPNPVSIRRQLRQHEKALEDLYKIQMLITGINNLEEQTLQSFCERAEEDLSMR